MVLTAAQYKRTVLAIVTAILLAASACTAAKSPPRPGPRASAITRSARFKPAEIVALDPKDRPEARQKADQLATTAMSLIDTFYDTAFVDPRLWMGGAHPGLASLFTQEARIRLQGDIEALALGRLAPQLTGVRVLRQQAPKITFLFEDDLSAPVVLVSTEFSAQGIPRGAGRAPLDISHSGDFWLSDESGAYKIYAYSVRLEAGTRQSFASFPAR